MTPELNDTDYLDGIRDEYFIRMMLPDAIEKALPYLEEDEGNIKELIGATHNSKNYNFVVIGSGPLWYLDLAYNKFKSYIAVEPLADTFLSNQVRFLLKKDTNIKVINKEFGEYEINSSWATNSIFVFHFNILSYIPDPIKRINKYLKKGDILYISSWNTTDKAKTVRKGYFDFLNNNTSNNSYKINPEGDAALSNLDAFPFEKLNFYKKHKRIKGKITDILIIYC